MANQQGQAFEDLRNTLSECWRIVRHRWRLAVIGLTVLGSLAFWYSQYLPRDYSATTLFERRDDVVLQNLISANSPYSFDRLKTTLTQDMTGSRALARAAVEVGLLPADTFTGEGALADHERSALDACLGKYDLRMTVSLPQSSPSLDAIYLQCTANDPTIARNFVIAVRQNYIAGTRERIHEILNGTKTFFESEVTRLQQQVALTDRDLHEGFDEYPGLDPTDIASVGNRLENLRFQRDTIRQRKAELEAQIAAREQFLIAAPGLYPNPPSAAETPPSAVTAAVAPGDEGLERAIEAVKSQVVDLVTGRRMTMEHPEVRRLLGRLDALENLRGTLAANATEPAPASAPATPQVASEAYREWQAQQMRVELELDSLRRQLHVATEQCNPIDARVDQFAALYEKLLSDGDSLRRLREQRSKGAAELNLWQGHLAHLDRVLTAESGERGTQFTILEEPKDVSLPVKPRIASVFVICPGLGAAAAALLVALAELFDRSFRSVSQVTRALGVPVLECVSVIPTPRERRRAIASRLVWTPTLVVLVFSLAATAALAYASLARPSLHRAAVQEMDRVLNAVGVVQQLGTDGGAS